MRLRLAGFAVAILVVLVGAPSPVAAASTATGRLYAFGDNYWGQLGSTTNNQAEAANPTPTVVTLPGATGPVTQVAAGSDDSFAVTSTGQLYAFGNNDSGQLGSATNSGNETANPTPAPVGLPAGTTISTVPRGPEASQTPALEGRKATRREQPEH